MSRLDNIIARDRARRRMTPVKVVWIAIGVLVIVVGAYLLFGDFSAPKRPPADHVDGVQLRRTK